MVMFRRAAIVLDNWRWRLRYWVLDKYHGVLRWVVFYFACMFSLAMLLVVINSLRSMAKQAASDHVVRADGGATLIVAIIAMVVSIAITYANRPKTEPIKPQEGTIPTVEDGKSIVRLYGTDWFDDSMILGWKNLGTEAIKSGGSKKWKPGLLPGTTNPIESWLDDKWNVSGLGDVDDPLGGGNHYPDEGGEFDPDGP